MLTSRISSISVLVGLMSIVLPMLQGDPITLIATSVSANYDHLSTYAVAGPGFNFTGNDFGTNLPQHADPGAIVTDIVGFVAISGENLGHLPVNQFEGSINVNGVQRPALFLGSASTAPGSTTFPSDLSLLPTLVSVPLTIQGSFTACLQPMSVGAAAPCDPQFLNYAVVNVNLPGAFNFYLNPDFVSYPSILITRETYTAAASAVPESSNFALLIAASLLAFPATKGRRLPIVCLLYSRIGRNCRSAA